MVRMRWLTNLQKIGHAKNEVHRHRQAQERFEATLKDGETISTCVLGIFSGGNWFDKDLWPPYAEPWVGSVAVTDQRFMFWGETAYKRTSFFQYKIDATETFGLLRGRSVGRFLCGRVWYSGSLDGLERILDAVGSVDPSRVADYRELTEIEELGIHIDRHVLNLCSSRDLMLNKIQILETVLSEGLNVEIRDPASRARVIAEIEELGIHVDRYVSGLCSGRDLLHAKTKLLINHY